MKIESYDVDMQANSSFIFEQKHSTEFSTFSQQLFTNGEFLQNENQSKIKLSSLRVESLNLVRAVLGSEDELSHEQIIKKRILEMILSSFTNKEIKLQPKENSSNNNDFDTKMNSKRNGLKTSSQRGFIFESTHKYYQKSTVEFNTQAFVQTNRGQINIDLNLNFSQEFYEEHKTRIVSNELKFEDPLIINYDGNLTTFDNISSEMSFEFDINSDGNNEEIPGLKDGAGFLVLDKNKNGEIDDGSELFGASSGDGFEELREYDEDGNNWIDENDSVFANLQIWEKNESGDGSLITLGQAGVGAIYLAAVDSNFTYSTSVSEDYAKLKQSSFYLKENGDAGLVTSSDFAV